jgi:hypothetical protein
MYHQQLAYCVMQYIEKDAGMAVPVVLGLLKSWPWSNSAKQVVYLNELEEVLELMGAEQLGMVLDPLVQTLARCVGSAHFQVRGCARSRGGSVCWLLCYVMLCYAIVCVCICTCAAGGRARPLSLE